MESTGLKYRDTKLPSYEQEYGMIEHKDRNVMIVYSMFLFVCEIVLLI